MVIICYLPVCMACTCESVYWSAACKQALRKSVGLRHDPASCCRLQVSFCRALHHLASAQVAAAAGFCSHAEGLQRNLRLPTSPEARLSCLLAATHVQALVGPCPSGVTARHT